MNKLFLIYYRKTMKTLLLFLSICLLFIQCSSGNGDDGKPYVFDKQENIDFNSIDYPEILGISMQLVKIDSLLLINDFHGDTLINVFNLNSGKIVKRLIPKGSGPGELISPLDIQLCDRNLYVLCRPEFSLNHGSVDSVTAGSFVISNDGLLPQKSDRFIPLTENQFVFSGLWNKRYILYNPSKASEIKEFGDYPNYWEGEKDFPENAKAMFHQSRFIKHPSKPYFASCSSFVLEIYEYDSTGINLPQLVFKKQLGNYSYNYTAGNILTANVKDGSDPEAKELACSAKYIYVVIQSGEDRKKSNIMVLDWDGNPVKLLKSDKTITCLSIDENSNRGYCIIEDPEDKLVYFDLKTSKF